MLRVTLSQHAKLQLRRRGIEAKEIREVLQNHHTTYPGTNESGDTVVVVGTCPDGRDLCVVHPKNNPGFIVTAYWRDET